MEILKQEFPDIEIYAFIDDVNMASKNSQSLAKAFVRLQEMVNAHNIELAPGKCVWFGGQEKIPIPEQLANEGVKAAYDSIKILGAHLGEDESVKSGLFQQLVRNTEALRRLKLMGANNVSLLLLSKSMNVRHQYAIRVHEPTLSDAVSLSFDNNVEKVLHQWLGEMTKKQIELSRLPLKKGGLGLTSCHSIRAASYETSRYLALERKNSISARAGNMSNVSAIMDNGMSQTAVVAPIDEVTTAAQLHQKAYEALKDHDPKLATILNATTRKGSYDWLQSNAKFVPTRAFQIAIMTRLGMPHPRLPKSLLCPGCRMLLDNKTALQHIPGCVQCTGLNATVKHNRLVKYIFDLAQKAGIQCEKEPRSFSTWQCGNC